jgi:hypothetical protein
MKKYTSPTEVLLSKLRQPLHISYICEHILKTNHDDCRLKINKLINDGLFEESQYGKDYFVAKK